MDRALRRITFVTTILNGDVPYGFSFKSVSICVYSVDVRRWFALIKAKNETLFFYEIRPFFHFRKTSRNRIWIYRRLFVNGSPCVCGCVVFVIMNRLSAIFASLELMVTQTLSVFADSSLAILANEVLSSVCHLVVKVWLINKIAKRGVFY